jgi:hypothetical protein
LRKSLARGVNGICPEVTSSPEPTMRTTWGRTRSTVMSRLSRTRAARPSSSRRRPSRDVLGADVVVLERPRLLMGEDDRAQEKLLDWLEV